MRVIQTSPRYYKIGKVDTMLLLVVGLFLVQGNLINGETPNSNRTEKLLENIRRQLMENNYDYTPSLDEIMSRSQFAQDAPNDSLDRNNYKYEDIHPELARREGTGVFVPKNGSKQEARRVEQTVSKKDLLYYVNDERLKSAGDKYVEEPNEDFDEFTNDAEISTPKYKVIKVKSAKPYRRSLSHQRFVQGQEPGGVSLISLDGAPFPEFHLPHSRRQYMPEDSDIEGNHEDGKHEDREHEDGKYKDGNEDGKKLDGNEATTRDEWVK